MRKLKKWKLKRLNPDKCDLCDRKINRRDREAVVDHISVKGDLETFCGACRPFINVPPKHGFRISG
jgi:hypothetical protein